MTSGMPDKNAPLTEDTFQNCRSVLYGAALGEFNEDVPNIGWTRPSPLPEKYVSSLERWLEYALDGDAGPLHFGEVHYPPNVVKEDVHTDVTNSEASLGHVSTTLGSDWSGAAAEAFTRYVDGVIGGLQEYTGDHSDDMAALHRAALRLEEATVVHVVFKQDLLSLAVATKKAIDAIDNDVDWESLALYGLLGTSVLLAGAGGILAGVTAGTTTVAAGGIFALVAGEFASAGVSHLDGSSFGYDLDEIMGNFDAKLTELVDGYSEAMILAADNLHVLRKELEGVTVPTVAGEVYTGENGEQLMSISLSEILMIMTEADEEYLQAAATWPSPAATVPVATPSTSDTELPPPVTPGVNVPH